MLARVDEDDNVRQVIPLVGTGETRLVGLEVDPCGRSVLFGRFSGRLDLGGGRALVAGGEALYVVVIPP